MIWFPKQSNINESNKPRKTHGFLSMGLRKHSKTHGFLNMARGFLSNGPQETT